MRPHGYLQEGRRTTLSCHVPGTYSYPDVHGGTRAVGPAGRQGGPRPAPYFGAGNSGDARARAPGIQRGKHRAWRLRPRLRDCPKSARKMEPRPLSASAPRHPSRALHCAIPCLGHDGIVLAGAVTSRSRGPSGPSGPSGPTAVLLPLQHAGRGPGRRRTQPRHAFITFYYSCFGREGSLLRFSSMPYLALPRPAALRVPLSPLLSEIVHRCEQREVSAGVEGGGDAGRRAA